MKGKIIYGLNFLWTSFIAFSFPVCLGIIYLDITGHSKGFGYDLGSEKGISIMFGCVELISWLVLAIPSIVYIFKKTKKKSPYYLMIPMMIYVALFLLCIQIIGGWHEFARCFYT